MRRDLVADAHAVAHQIQQGQNLTDKHSKAQLPAVTRLRAASEITRSYQRDPQHQIFIDETVEVLIEEQQARPEKRHVVKMHLALGHVSHLREPGWEIKHTQKNRRKRILFALDAKPTFLIISNPSNTLATIQFFWKTVATEIVKNFQLLKQHQS